MPIQLESQSRRINSEKGGSMLDELSQAQRERLAFIEFRLFFLGKVGRSDVMGRFDSAPAGATRDFALYKDLAPNNAVFDNTSKTYVIGERFVPIFEHIPERVMTALSQGFGDGVSQVTGPLIPYEMPIALNRPQMNVLAPITRAINLGKAVRLQYYSATSGASERELVPYAIASDGLRWHARVFDRQKQRFTDFVISRMSDVVVIHDRPVERHELPVNDIQWNRIVELDLVPHPDNSYPELVKRDFGMVDGVLHLKLRAAMAGYVLRQWHVDCSLDHHMADNAFRLWLKDPLALYGVESANWAPGYKSPNSASS